MTGFGLSGQKKKSYDLQVSIKSVNGRFLETRFHLPKEFVQYEGELKKQIEKKVSRGTLDIFVHRKGAFGNRKLSIFLQKNILSEWLKAQKELQSLSQKSAAEPRELSIQELVALPFAVEWFETSSSSTGEKSYLVSTFKKALAQFESSRFKEGQYLKKELLMLFRALETSVDQMRRVRESANLHFGTRLKEKLKTLGFGQDQIEQKLNQEILFLIDKSDITEELSRLHQHVKNCLKLLNSKQPEGKRLEFYNQELLREVNTIGSKSQLSELTELVVNSKTIIEKIREQVQNIE